MRATFLLVLLFVFSSGIGLLGAFLIFTTATGGPNTGTAVTMFIVTLVLTSLVLGLILSERPKLWDAHDPIKRVALIGLVAGIVFAGLFILLSAALNGA